MRPIAIFLWIVMLFSGCAQKSVKADASIAIKILPTMNKENDTVPDNYFAVVDSLIAIHQIESAEKMLLVMKKNFEATSQMDGYIRTVMSLCQIKASVGNVDSGTGALGQNPGAVIDYLTSEMQGKPEPVHAILTNLLAGTYVSLQSYQHFRQQDATTVENDPNEDYLTWSMEKLQSEINRLYLSSISADTLKSIPIRNISLITNQELGNDGIRSVFDFLAYRVLDYMKNSTNYVTEPIYKFQITGNEFFAVATDFSKTNFKTLDSLSMVYQSVSVYQKLLDYYEKYPDSRKAFELVNFERLRFMYLHSVDPDKVSLYIKALSDFVRENPPSPQLAIYEWEIIKIKYENDTYSVDSPETGDRTLLVSLYREAEALIKKYQNKNLPGVVNAADFMQMLRSPSLSLQAEKVLLPDQANLLFVRYTNLSKGSVQLYRLSRAEYLSYSQRPNDDDFKQFKFLKNIEFTLKDPGDFREHTAEVKIDQLAPGYYLLNRGEGSNDYYNTKLLFQVSNLAAISIKDNGSVAYRVVNRLTGDAIAGCNIDYYASDYRNNYILTKISHGKTDKNGFARIQKLSGRSVQAVFYLNGNELADENSGYLNDRRFKPERKNEYQTFLDRAIYRPGQTVFFKSIVYQRDNNRIPAISPGARCKVVLYDVNHQEISSQTLTSNDFGSVNGSFSLPSGGLTGNFSIQINGVYAISFSVEEYKRPKFEVVFDSLDRSYSLGNEVVLRGHVKNYAGTPLDGATVWITVSRSQIWRWYGWYYDWGMPGKRNNKEMVIANILTTTDSKGEFEIKFPAFNDPGIDKKSNPQFRFAIHADVTDINGETQSADKSLAISYNTYDVNYKVPNPIDVSALNSFGITVSGIEGNPITRQGILKVEQLKEPSSYLRPKAYQNPEFVLLDRSEYKKLWPYEAYLNEANPENWPVLSTLVDKKVISGVLNLNDLSSGKMKIGTYRISFIPDGEKNPESKNQMYLRVSSDMKKNLIAPSFNRLLTASFDKDLYTPGDVAKVGVSSRNPSGRVALMAMKNGETLLEKWVDASHLYDEAIKIRKADLGGVTFIAYAYGDSRLDRINLKLNVPWSMKDLGIQLVTFRDKLLPGQEETWSFKISGNKKDTILAEVLATMYDQSLDAFAKADYQKIIFPEESGYLYLNDVNNGVQALPIISQNGFNSNAYTDFNGIGYKQKLTDRYYLKTYYPYYSRRYMMEAASADGAVNRSLPVAAAKQSVGDAEIKSGDLSSNQQNETAPAPVIPALRTNLDETVFFYPQLLTDKEGNVSFNFKMKEALTRWKLRIFGHTKELAQGYIEKQVTTSKELMIFPNLPRFFREMDTLVLSAKISSLENVSGKVRASIELIDELNGRPISAEYYLEERIKEIDLPAGGSQVVNWKIKSPQLPVEVVGVKMTAEVADHQDGELNVLPVLTNRMMVTETMPFQVRSGQSKEFSFDAMTQTFSSTSVVPYRYTLEYTSNPVWYAIQALPYIMEYPYECTEQVLNRYVANSLATDVVHKFPKIKTVFDQWKTKDELQSNLNKNQELKSALLQETPWVLQAKSEAEQQRNIALLFDFNKMSNEARAALQKILERQNPDGSFSWFPGCGASEYVTSYVIENLGHLRQIGVISDDRDKIDAMARSAIQFCDSRVEEHYADLMRQKEGTGWKPDEKYFDYWVSQYFYARSFFEKDQLPQTQAFQYYFGQIKKNWKYQSLYLMGISALVLERNGDHAAAATIIEGLKQSAHKSDELGMYWDEAWSWYWYQLPIETQSLMIEAFNEITGDKPAVDEMKLWLLKSKQTNHWPTTKATASAIYAIMLTGGVSSLETVPPELSIGKQFFDLSSVAKQAGTGYFKLQFNQNEIRPEMAEINVSNKSAVVNWGGVYWQYFEDMDKIKTFKGTPLNISKKYFKVKKTDRGESLLDITDHPIQVGDRIRVRTIIRVDRPMEFVHLKDMRPAGLEQVENTSGYRYEHGLGYYQAPKDLANNFFIDYLRPGTYTFEYDLVASLKGNFSTGISTIQCMYAPEFSSHSDGDRIRIE